jgi:3-oxoacyl-[acyl-carrier protein] reductase
MAQLSGKVAVVTGSSGGIGAATAVELATQGADVVLQYRSRESEAKKLANNILGLGRRAVLAKVDFMDTAEAPKDVQKMITQTINQFGKVDILVNLAGYPARGEWNKRFLELTRDDFYKPLNVDVFGSFLCAQAVAPHMLKQKKGVIVNASSTPALSGHDKGFSFTVAKAAIIGMTKALAFELAPHIRVNTVALGNIRTEWIHELSNLELRNAEIENLMNRLGTAEEIAKSIAFLCSDDSSFVNGQTIVLDGGSTLH